MSFQDYKFLSLHSEEIWKQELRYILERDIHEEGLGCCVDHTHVKIGDVHIGKFYEAQFLFGNAYWISIFCHALKIEFMKCGYERGKKILFIGYETYIEPVILQLQELLQNDNYMIDVCIYEEPKYVLKNTLSAVRLRSGKDIHVCEYDDVVLICGISSTLSTFRQMKRHAENNGKQEEKEQKPEQERNYRCFSIIQVLPDDFKEDVMTDFSFIDKGNLHHNPETQELTRTFSNSSGLCVKTKYLIAVFCEWEMAQTCKWCYNDTLERPIIATNETSVIPVQMIGIRSGASTNATDSKINFFQRDSSGEFIYKDFLYYSHIERSSHHFQYYIRTNSLFKFILNHPTENEKLTTFCSEIQNKLGLSATIDENQKAINVLVVPTHYSNEHFLNVISRRVFNNRAEIISFDPQKEFRSNFETKFSNYSYIWEALKNDTQAIINFHYIDDEIITGNTFYKAKSYVSSLVSKTLNRSVQNNIQIFKSIITLINRNSISTRRNYVHEVDNIFALIDISVPSLRNHGDSCYLCSMQRDAQIIKRKSAFIKMEQYWQGKENDRNVITLDKAKRTEDIDIRVRHFRRFYCENLMWKSLKSNWSSADIIYKEILEIFGSELNKKTIAEQYEYLISFIKVTSKPYLYYRENIKKAIHSVMLYLIHIMNFNPHINPRSMVAILKAITYGDHKKAYADIEHQLEDTKNRTCEGLIKEKYYLYVMLLSRLSTINSNYLIKADNIAKAFLLYDTLFPDTSNKNNPVHISEYVGPFIKRITNGISGEHKAKKLDEEIERATIEPQYMHFFRTIYLENLEAIDRVASFQEKKEDNNLSTKEKYEKILNSFDCENSTALVVRFDNDNDYFVIANSIHCSQNIFDRRFLSTIAAPRFLFV